MQLMTTRQPSAPYTGPEADAACRLHLLTARSLGVTAFAAIGVSGFLLFLAKVPCGPLPPAAFIPLCVVSLAVYAYELSSRHVWEAASSIFRGIQFSTFAEAMRDAAPLVDLEVEGWRVVPYEVAQWRDETPWLDDWLDFGADVKRGLVLASFPLEFIPGDHMELTALDFAKDRLAQDFATTSGETPLSPLVDLRLRLQWPSGDVTEEPTARLLQTGSGGADFVSPLPLLLSCIFLLGLIVDLVLVQLAEPVEWPVRKRFFTREGGRLGTLSFSCSPQGAVEVEGDIEELQKANRFWIKSEEQWQTIESEVRSLNGDLVRTRWCRRGAQGCAVLVTVAVAGWAVLAHGRKLLLRAPALLLVLALAAAGLYGLSLLADWVSQWRVQACSRRLAKKLPGGARVTVSWGRGEEDTERDLSIEVEQFQPAIDDQRLPVLRTTSAPLAGPSLATLCNRQLLNCKAEQPHMDRSHRSQTI